jgi:hypothetical protein
MTDGLQEESMACMRYLRSLPPSELRGTVYFITKTQAPLKRAFSRIIERFRKS